MTGNAGEYVNKVQHSKLPTLEYFHKPKRERETGDDTEVVTNISLKNN